MGIGRSEKVLTDSHILRLSCCKPFAPPQSMVTPIILINMKQKATGKPVAITINNPPKISRRIKGHSTDIAPITKK
jgi:hypothetical protein